MNEYKAKDPKKIDHNLLYPERRSTPMLMKGFARTKLKKVINRNIFD